MGHVATSSSPSGIHHPEIDSPQCDSTSEPVSAGNSARIGRWARFRANAAIFFRKPTRLPLVGLLAILTISIPQIVGPTLRQSYRIGIDLQKYGCLPYVLYLFKAGGVDPRLPPEKHFDLERGMYVNFVPENNVMQIPELDGQSIVKQVAGLPGDELVVKDDVAYINGREWGKLWLLKTLKREPGSYDRREVVPDGKVLLMGTLKTSYDGRYYGFVDQSLIRAQAFALLLR